MARFSSSSRSPKGCLSVILGVFFGIAMFIGSFVLLFWNEGTEDLSKAAEEAVPFERIDQAETDKLVYLVDQLHADETVHDQYLVDQNYVFFVRYVEMYAYEEETRTDRDTDETTYHYSAEWTRSPTNPRDFEGPQRDRPHDIPEDFTTWLSDMPSTGQSLADTLTIKGQYSVSTNDLTMSNANRLTLDESRIDSDALDDNETIESDAIFRQNSKNGTLDNPDIGDVRIQYRVITEDDEGLLLATFDGTAFHAYTTEEGNTLYRFFNTVTTLEEATDILRTEYIVQLWIFRVVGFLLMFLGLMLIGLPIQAVTSFLPALSRATMFIYGAIAFGVSLVLTTFTIIVARIYYNVYLLVGVIALMIIITVIMLNRRKRKALEEDAEAHASHSS